jgi:hypothetical protein
MQMLALCLYISNYICHYAFEDPAPNAGSITDRTYDVLIITTAMINMFIVMPLGIFLGFFLELLAEIDFKTLKDLALEHRKCSDALRFMMTLIGKDFYRLLANRRGGHSSLAGERDSIIEDELFPRWCRGGMKVEDWTRETRRMPIGKQRDEIERITPTNVHRMLESRHRGLQVKPQQLRFLMRVLDTDRDGHVGFREFQMLANASISRWRPEVEVDEDLVEPEYEDDNVVRSSDFIARHYDGVYDGRSTKHAELATMQEAASNDDDSDDDDIVEAADDLDGALGDLHSNPLVEYTARVDTRTTAAV